MLYSAKYRAKQKKVPFQLTIDDIAAPDTCPVLGIRLDYGGDVRRRAAKSNSPTLDRVIPSAGYVRGNVMVMSHRANTIKTNATPEEIMAVARYLEVFA